MRDSPLLPTRPHQNLGDFFGAPRGGGVSDVQSITATMNIFKKSRAAPEVQLLLCHMNRTLCHSSAQNPTFYTDQAVNNSSWFGHFAREQTMAVHKPG